MRILIAAVMPLVLAGCVQPEALPAADPLVRAAEPALARTVPAGPTVTYTKRTITEPEDWRRLNDEQAPGGTS